MHRIRIRAKALGITKIDATQTTISIEFRADTPIDGLAIIKLIQSNDGYRMNGARPSDTPAKSLWIPKLELTR